MIEILFILALLFAVFILFYRQAIEQYTVLQIEATQLADLPKLLSERAPVVVRECGLPKVFTADALKSNPRLLSYPLGQQQTLGQYLKSEAPPRTVKMPKKASLVLASESGLQVWAEHTWFPRFFTQPLWEAIHSLTVEAHLGEKGLRKTTALTTLIYPTTSALEVTLCTETQQQYLPKTWRGRFPETFTIQDTPLVGEIKYITVKLRPGNVLCLPTHWFVSIRAADPTKPTLWAWMELHNPISLMASKMEASLEI